MTEQSIGTLPHQFAEDFVRAYEKQIAEAERLQRQAKPKKKPVIEKVTARYDKEELVDQTAEASYEDNF